MLRRRWTRLIFSRERIGYPMKSYSPIKPKARKTPPDYAEKKETQVMWIHTSDTEFGPGWAVWQGDVIKYTRVRRDGKYESVDIRKDSVTKWK